MSTKKTNKPTIKTPDAEVEVKPTASVTYVNKDDNEATETKPQGISQEAIKPSKEQGKLTEDGLLASVKADAKARGKNFKVCPITGVLVTY